MTEAQEAAARADLSPHVLARAIEQAANDRGMLARMLAANVVREAKRATDGSEARAFAEDINVRAFGPRINVAIRPKAKRRRR